MFNAEWSSAFKTYDLKNHIINIAEKQYPSSSHHIWIFFIICFNKTLVKRVTFLIAWLYSGRRLQRCFMHLQTDAWNALFPKRILFPIECWESMLCFVMVCGRNKKWVFLFCICRLQFRIPCSVLVCLLRRKKKKENFF